MEVNNIRNTLIELLETDKDYTDKDNKYIKNLYENAPKEQKEFIDTIFVRLCGMSLKTITQNNEGK